MNPISFSNLKALALSPAHYLARLTTPMSPTPAMRLGTLVHTLVLGGPAVVVYDGERRGNAWTGFQAANKGKEIVTVSEWDKAHRCADAVRAHPHAWVLAGRHEVPLSWSRRGRACQTGGVDCVGLTHLSELKTASTVEPWKFRRACLQMGYHAQLAWYQDALATSGQLRQDAYILGVETSPPHCVTVLKLSPAALEAGHALCDRWLTSLLECERTNQWPGYSNDVLELEVEQESEPVMVDGEWADVA